MPYFCFHHIDDRDLLNLEFFISQNVVRRDEHVSASHGPATRGLLRGHAEGTLGGAGLGPSYVTYSVKFDL